MPKYLNTNIIVTTTQPTTPAASDFSLHVNENIKVSDNDFSAVDYNADEHEDNDRMRKLAKAKSSIESLPAVSASLASLTNDASEMDGSLNHENNAQDGEGNEGEEEEEDDMFSENFQISNVAVMNEL
jgi:hypothetical protein